MKNKKPNAALIWKQFEDLVVPRLRLSVIDRAVYSHLLRHSRLDVCRLLDHGALRLVERTKAGHVVEVRLPEEIRAVRRDGIGARSPAALPTAASLEETDFLKSKVLRQAIHARERGRCFYCLRRLTSCILTLDHVVPRVDLGRNSYRNLVSCCLECNSQKRERPAADFLRWLYREHRLTPAELTGRLRALDALARGKLRPPQQTSAKPARRA